MVWLPLVVFQGNHQGQTPYVYRISNRDKINVDVNDNICYYYK